jgi:hypothetical protein
MNEENTEEWKISKEFISSNQEFIIKHDRDWVKNLIFEHGVIACMLQKALDMIDKNNLEEAIWEIKSAQMFAGNQFSSQYKRI